MHDFDGIARLGGIINIPLAGVVVEAGLAGVPQEIVQRRAKPRGAEAHFPARNPRRFIDPARQIGLELLAGIIGDGINPMPLGVIFQGRRL